MFEVQDHPNDGRVARVVRLHEAEASTEIQHRLVVRQDVPRHPAQTSGSRVVGRALDKLRAEPASRHLPGEASPMMSTGFERDQVTGNISSSAAGRLLKKASTPSSRITRGTAGAGIARTPRSDGYGRQVGNAGVGRAALNLVTPMVHDVELAPEVLREEDLREHPPDGGRAVRAPHQRDGSGGEERFQIHVRHTYLTFQGQPCARSAGCRSVRGVSVARRLMPRSSTFKRA